MSLNIDNNQQLRW